MTPKHFEKGDIVLVNGPPGEVIGEVLHASTPDELPDLGPASASKEALDLDVMREMRVHLVFLIADEHDDRTRIVILNCRRRSPPADRTLSEKPTATIADRG